MSETKKTIDDATDAELVAELARRRAKGGFKDMTAAEDAGEAFLAADGEVLVGEFLRAREAAQTNEAKPCPRCGRLVRVRVANRPRTVRTTLGERTFARHYHHCDECDLGFYPLDNELALPREGDVTARLADRVLDLGVNETFADAAARWSVHHAGTISETLVRRVVERAGRSVEAADPGLLQRALREPSAAPASLMVVQTDGSMLPIRGGEGWREAKLGVIYREENHASRHDVGRGCVTEARYVGKLGSQDEFRTAIDAALQAEQVDRASRIAWIGDGAPCNWTLAEEVCPKATQILDWTHAIEHGIDCGKAVLGENDPMRPIWEARIAYLLWNGEVQTLLAELEGCRFLSRGAAREAINGLQRYYRNNAHRMDYARFRTEGLPIGSGTVESGHRHVFQKRMKLAGQHWSLANARRMVMLRAVYRTVGARAFGSAIRAASLSPNVACSA